MSAAHVTSKHVPYWVETLALFGEVLNEVALLDAALVYAELGIPIFPLIPGTKIPYAGTKGKDDATTDIARIERFWKRHPDSNIGGLCGELFSVLDVDTKRAVNGWAAINTLAPTGLLSGAFLQAQTPSWSDGLPHGGHCYFPPFGGGHGSAKFAIDYKSTGGYVLLAPSVITQGTEFEQGKYLWRSFSPERYGPTFDWDMAIRVLEPQSAEPKKMRFNPTNKNTAGPVKRLATAQEGERNSVLYWAACTLTTEGNDPEVLLPVALSIGLTEREARNTIASATRMVGVR